MRRLASSKWVKIFKTIPDYDIFATAGDCYFDEGKANDAIEFIETFLTHVKGEWALRPFLLEPWEKAIVGALFGWMRPNGLRRFKEAFVFLPRKNGKSALAAAIILYGMFCDGEGGAEFYSAAAERDQAALVFDQAKGMVLQSPDLSERAQVFTKAITIESILATYKAISADAATKHGYNPHIVVVDELHAQKNRELVDVLETGMSARQQPLMIYITTSDYDRESICNEVYDYAVKVRDGVVPAPNFLPVIFEAKLDDDWKSEATWKKANPNYGISKKKEYMEEHCRKAQEIPSYENTFKRLDLNIKTEQDIRWIPLALWDASGQNAKNGIDNSALRQEDLLGKPCFGAVDLASTTDLASFALFFPEYCAMIWRFWCPKNAIPDVDERGRRRRRVSYEAWSKAGLLKGTPGDVIDYDYIRQDIKADSLLYDIQDIAIDRWNATQLATQLSGDGFEVTPFGQGFASMNAPCKELESLLAAKKLVHFDNPIARWMASNCCIEMDAAGNIKLAKNISKGKIDGIVSGVMSIGRAISTVTVKKSKYEEDGEEGQLLILSAQSEEA